MTKQTSKGQTVEITVLQHDNVRVTLDGKFLGETYPNIIPLPTPVMGNTYKLPVGGGNAIALTDAEADALRSEIDAMPLTMTELINKRRTLKATIAGANDMLNEIMERAVRTSKLDQLAQDEWQAKRDERIAALQAFDAAHPEVLDELARQTADSVKRGETY